MEYIKNYRTNIKEENNHKLILYSNMNNNEMMKALNNFFKVFTITYTYEGNKTINCVTYFVGKITGPSILLFDIQLQHESKDDYILSIHLINKSKESQNYSLKELYDLLNKYLNNSMIINDFNSIFTFSSNKIRDCDIVQSLVICHNMMAVDTIFSLKILLLLSNQSPESCLDEIHNLFKLLSKNIMNNYETLIPQYIVLILSILSNNRKYTKKILFYLPIVLDDYYLLEKSIQSCNIKFIRYHMQVIFGNIFNNINIIDHIRLLDKIRYHHLLRLRKDFISNDMIKNVKNIDNYIFRQNMILFSMISSIILIIYFIY
jgi:hypothetical protein